MDLEDAVRAVGKEPAQKIKLIIHISGGSLNPSASATFSAHSNTLQLNERMTDRFDPAQAHADPTALNLRC